MAGVQTAMAQKVTLYMADNQTFECDIAQLDSIVFSEAQTIPAEEIVVNVDANGNADGGHQFTRIDETTFLIDGLKYEYKNGGLTVIGYDPVFFSGTAKVISKLIYNGRTMNVVGIGNSAFKNCLTLTSVIIGSGVTSIGGRAFYECTSLTSITIPESVTSIEDAFDGCNSLQKVIVPDIAAWCGISFRNITANPLLYANHIYCDENTEIVDLVIPDGVTSISNYAFSGCSSLTSITIPESVTSIGSSAFSKCTGLTSINIPESVTSIGFGAFSSCKGLTSINIPESVTSIGGSAFSVCSSLTSITIPESVTSIGDYAFLGCSSLTSIIVENGNTLYDSRNNCNAIIETATNTLIAGCMNTVIPESVTSIGGSAFYGCSSLTSITIGSGVTSIGLSAFRLCTSLTSVTIPNSVTSIGNYAFDGCSSLPSIIIPESVTSIDYGAFSDCSSLNSITIPENVTSIGNYAFSGCSGLTSVTLESNDIVSAARSSSLSMNTIFGNQVEEYIIGNNVTSICSSAFYNCSSLTSITIPKSVTSIGDNAFYKCVSLTDVYCYAENPPRTGHFAFDSTLISSATLHVPAGSVDAYKARLPWKSFGTIVAIE